MNFDFSKIDSLIDANAHPGCCKNLVRALAIGAPKKMTSSTFTSGTDTKPLFELGLITRDPRTSEVRLSDKGKGLLSTL